MEILDHNKLKRDFFAVFKQFYEDEVADSLAVMHAHFHLRFARGVSEVPVSVSDERKMIIRQSRVSSTIRRVREPSLLASAAKESDNIEIEEEIYSIFESFGVNHPIRFRQLCDALQPFDVSEKEIKKQLTLLRNNKLVEKIPRYGGALFKWIGPPIRIGGRTLMEVFKDDSPSDPEVVQSFLAESKKK